MAAAAANILVWVIARAFGASMDAVTNGQLVQIGPLVVVLTTLLSALIAGTATGITAKLVRQPIPWVVMFGLILTATSLSAPLGQPSSTSRSTVVALVVMHLVTSIIVLVGLVRGLSGDDRAMRT